MKAVKVAISAVALAYGSAAIAAEADGKVRLSCDGILYLHGFSGKSESQYQMNITIEKSKMRLNVETAGIFSETFIITDAKELEYYLVSSADLYKKDAKGFSRINRSNGYLVLAEDSVDGDYSKGYSFGKVFNGNCRVAKALF